MDRAKSPLVYFLPTDTFAVNATTAAMDQKRAKTLEALEEFIQAQKTLLTATSKDIDRLRKARAAAVADPVAFCNDIHANLEAPSFRLSALPDWQLKVPEDIEWSVFEGLDPAPLQKFTLDTQKVFTARNEPYSTQTSPLSDLQKLVKNARRTILDPALAAFSGALESGGDSSSEIDEEEVQRERERAKIRQLKRRQIRTCGLKLPGLRIEGSAGVFIRHDVEDESMDVDISVGNSDRSSTPGAKLSPIVHPILHSKPSRSRRPTKKAVKDPPPSSRGRKKAQEGRLVDECSPILSVEVPKEKGKPKPETYKQAWSVSEQHLLEQLLEQIPEGEKYRWQKISRAMNGRRTPRQVASRVQKYFEKLKKYGLDGRSGQGAEGAGKA